MRTLVIAVSLVACLGCKKAKDKLNGDESNPEEKGSIFANPPEHRKKKKKEEEAEPPQTPESSDAGSAGESHTTAAPPTQGDKDPDGKPRRPYERCALRQVVSKGDRATPEGTLHMAYQALLEANDDVAFQKFVVLVDTDFQSPEAVKRFWLYNARKNDKKNLLRLVYGPKDPTFVVCDRREEGSDVRLFVGKTPPEGSNPPVVLHQKDKKWLIKRFTPY